jgi:hypothetical protein
MHFLELLEEMGPTLPRPMPICWRTGYDCASSVRRPDEAALFLLFRNLHHCLPTEKSSKLPDEYIARLAVSCSILVWIQRYQRFTNVDL